MLKHRVIPTLLIKNEGLVKTYKFADPKYVGDPINAIHIFNEKEVDELIVLDIEASKANREINFSLIEKIAGECFMPLCYGGGIRTLEQAQRLFTIGVEKICLQTAVFDNLDIISELAEKFGSQAILLSIDIKRNWYGKPEIYSAARKKTIKEPWKEFIENAILAGAGEIVLNSVNNDGTMLGMDFELIEEVSKDVSIPLIAIGGVSSLDDIKKATDVGADAVGVGAFFVFHGKHRAVLITYPNYHELEKLWIQE